MHKSLKILLHLKYKDHVLDSIKTRNKNWGTYKPYDLFKYMH